MKNFLFLALLFFPALSFAQVVPDFPMAFWGEVTIDGVEAPEGSVIRLYDDSGPVGEVVVDSAGIYGYTEPTKQKLIVGEGQGLITFKVQSPGVRGGVETEGLSPITYPEFASGETIELDLAFETVPEVVQEPRRNSGGGGSSRSRADETPASAVLGVSTSTEDMTEEEYKIVLQKQLIEILTQLIALLKLKMLAE